MLETQAHDYSRADLALLRPSRGRWFSVRVDRGWPPTWDHTHCGACDAHRWTIERRREGGWALLDRTGYPGDRGRVVGLFATVERVEHWLAKHTRRDAVCQCEG